MDQMVFLYNQCFNLVKLQTYLNQCCINCKVNSQAIRILQQSEYILFSAKSQPCQWTIIKIQIFLTIIKIRKSLKLCSTLLSLLGDKLNQVLWRGKGSKTLTKLCYLIYKQPLKSKLTFLSLFHMVNSVTCVLSQYTRL